MLIKQNHTHFFLRSHQIVQLWQSKEGFPVVGKESTCNAGEPGSIPGSGRSAGEGIGYPLQQSQHLN